ncbi:MAG: hypothetical protein HYZ45_05845 [Burkholderiales bacterium]|nr:hypothetical protein [Burkholderiales bacterium]
MFYCQQQNLAYQRKSATVRINSDINSHRFYFEQIYSPARKTVATQILNREIPLLAWQSKGHKFKN